MRFERTARDMGLWQQVTLMTYSEFGRRFHENGPAGTDHGTAAPVIPPAARSRAGWAASGRRWRRAIWSTATWCTLISAAYAASAMTRGAGSDPCGRWFAGGGAFSPVRILG